MTSGLVPLVLLAALPGLRVDVRRRFMYDGGIGDLVRTQAGLGWRRRRQMYLLCLADQRLCEAAEVMEGWLDASRGEAA